MKRKKNLEDVSFSKKITINISILFGKFLTGTSCSAGFSSCLTDKGLTSSRILFWTFSCFPKKLLHIISPFLSASSEFSIASGQASIIESEIAEARRNAKNSGKNSEKLHFFPNLCWLLSFFFAGRVAFSNTVYLINKSWDFESKQNLNLELSYLVEPVKLRSSEQDIFLLFNKFIVK